MSTIKQLNGISNCKKKGMIQGDEDNGVTIVDGDGFVYLRQETSTFSSALTPEQADHLGILLTESARRLRREGK